jgi:hypothetical protein
VSGDLDIASRLKCGINDWLNVGLTLDDLNQHVTGSHPELIDRIGLQIVGIFDSDAVYVQCHGKPLTQNNEVRPKLSLGPIRGLIAILKRWPFVNWAYFGLSRRKRLGSRLIVAAIAMIAMTFVAATAPIATKYSWTMEVPSPDQLSIGSIVSHPALVESG